MQASALTSDFTCLPPDIITTIALTSGQIWRTLARVNHKCSGTLSWKAFVQRFSSVGVVTMVTTASHTTTKIQILNPERTWIKLLDGVPHSEDGPAWKIEVGTGYSAQLLMSDPQVGYLKYTAIGVCLRGKFISSDRPLEFTLLAVEWEVRQK
jgi:hypothetical protein